jgi:hypothetical protein
MLEDGLVERKKPEPVAPAVPEDDGVEDPVKFGDLLEDGGQTLVVVALGSSYAGPVRTLPKAPTQDARAATLNQDATEGHGTAPESRLRPAGDSWRPRARPARAPTPPGWPRAGGD